MNRKQRRKWLRKPEFKHSFSNQERDQANTIIKATNGLNSRLSQGIQSLPTLKNKN